MVHGKVGCVNSRFSDHGPRIRSRVGAILVTVSGVALCFAGILKLPMDFTPIFVGLPPIAVGLFDLIIGGLLLACTSSLLVRSSAVAIFAVYMGVNIYQVTQGVPTCGCFGNLDVAPAYVAFFDGLLAIGIVSSLAADRHDLQNQPHMLAAIGVAGILFTAYLSLWPARDEPRLVVSQEQLTSIVDFRNPHYEKWNVRVENPMASSIALIGWNATCSDLQVAGDFPVLIAAGAHAMFEIAFDKDAFELDEAAIDRIRCMFESPTQALLFAHDNSIRFLSDRGGRVEFEIKHSQSIAPAIVDFVFSK